MVGVIKLQRAPFFNGRRSVRGRSPATSQLERLVSTTIHGASSRLTPWSTVRSQHPCSMRHIQRSRRTPACHRWAPAPYHLEGRGRRRVLYILDGPLVLGKVPRRRAPVSSAERRCVGPLVHWSGRPSGLAALKRWPQPPSAWQSAAPVGRVAAIPRLPARNVLNEARGIDSTANQLDSERIDAVRHRNRVFHCLLKHVPWATLDRLVDEHEGGRDPRSF